MIGTDRIVQAARNALGLDIAFVSQFVGDERIFRFVDPCAGRPGITPGLAGPLAGSHCRLIVDGALPGVLPDTGRNPVAVAMPVTHELGIGALVGAPVRLSDGTLFGTLCCVSQTPRATLDHKDLATLQAFADLVANSIERDMGADRERAAKERRIAAVIAAGGPAVVYQPVFMLDDLRVAGAEALSRFPGPGPAPDVWFRESAEVGLQVEFELLAIRRALDGFRPIWAEHRIQLGLNASAATIMDERFWAVLDRCPRHLVVVELTEHEEVQDYAALLRAVRRHRAEGTKIAIDDVGAGFSSMRHVLNLRPDILKLDVALTRSIDVDELRGALVSALKHFAERFDCRLVAEGVETERELATLRGLGLQAAQGYLLGRPAPADKLLARLGRGRARVPPLAQAS